MDAAVVNSKLDRINCSLFLTTPSPHRRWLEAALCVPLIIPAAPIAGSGESEEPHNQYRVPEWNDLGPEGWEPPMVPEPYDEVGTSSIDKASVVAELNLQLVALPGSMKPVVFEGKPGIRVPVGTIPAASHTSARAPRCESDGIYQPAETLAGG